MSLFRNLNFRQKCFGTLFCVVVYFLMLQIPVPFTNRTAVANAVSSSGLFVFERLTGGDLSNMSFVALGVSPYISASIFLQIAGVLLPAIHSMQKDGSSGEQKLKRITFVLAVIISLVSGFGLAFGYGAKGLLTENSRLAVFVSGFCFTLGVVLLCCLAKLITDRFFGDGISVFLVCGILRSFVSDIVSFYVLCKQRFVGFVFYLVIGLFSLLFVGLILFLIWTQKKDTYVTILRPDKIVAVGTINQKYSSIPIRMLSGGVMPAVFASSAFVFPRLIGNLFGAKAVWLEIFDTSKWFNNGMPSWQIIGVAVYFLFILWAEFYCQSLSISPTELADYLKQNSAIVKGIMPGKQTEVYLRDVFRKASIRSSYLLGFIVIVPQIVSSAMNISKLGFMGTSLVIVVFVLYDMFREFLVELRLGKMSRNGNLLKFAFSRGG